MIVDKLKKVVCSCVENIWEIKEENVSFGIKIPPNSNLGDFAIECFQLSKILSKKVVDVSMLLAEALKSEKMIGDAVASGPYVNVTLDATSFFSSICKYSLIEKKSTGKNVMVEFLSPNTNKPIHLGHVRNGVIGMAMANLFKWDGENVIKACLVNDRGVHICKSMLTWKMYGNGEIPETKGMKGDHFVGSYYVMFSQKASSDSLLDEAAMKMLSAWEASDPETVAIWNMMNEWVYAGFEQTYQQFGFKFDVVYKESETYKLGKDFVKIGLDKGIFHKDSSGAVIYTLPEKEFGLNKDGAESIATILRNDGTSVYMTQDIGTAIKKSEDYNLQSSVYVVGDEQKHHFKTLFKILSEFGYSWVEHSHHLAYGMVLLPSGKMKSREGIVVDADNLLDEVVGYAMDWVTSKGDDSIDVQEVNRRAHVIGAGAIKFFLLSANPKKTICFDPEKSISFDGATGPYCQYAYARARRVLHMSGRILDSNSTVMFNLLGNSIEERVLARAIALLPDALEKSVQKYDPSILASAIFQLAKAMNQFYNKCPILSVDNNLLEARLYLMQSASETLMKSLGILGIDVLEEM